MKIGKIIGINYSQLKVKLASEIRGGSVNLRGEIYYFGNIGSYLKVTNSVDEVIICEVTSIFDSDLHGEKLSFDIESHRELSLKPIGTISSSNEFSLGVGIFPSLYSDVSIVTHEDMKLILNVSNDLTVNQEDKKTHQTFSLGVSKNLINYPIEIGINNFFNIHSAVLGNSGSGKSNTIAHILQEIHKKQNKSAVGSRILIFDVNGEYKEAFPRGKYPNISINYTKPNIQMDTEGYKPFYLPHFLLSLDEWSSFLLASEATQRPFWDKVLQESYRFFKIGTSDVDESKNKFVHYLRLRICNLIYSALQQADSDTVRVTTAVGILGTISSIINSNELLLAASTELLADIQLLQKACKLKFGLNDSSLQTATDEILVKVDRVLAQNVFDQKIKTGEFFDYRFLKVAAELILLEEDARGNKQIRGYTATMLTRLDYFLNNPDCEFMRESNGINMVGGYLSQLWGSDLSKTQLVIIDTSELSPDVLETITNVTARIIFDERRKLIGDKRRECPIHLILDEAHRYIKKNYNYLLKENVFEKIAREGRKYSFYLFVSSQRPSELSETVLSQCANFIIHRIQNERDMHYIQAILPYFSDDFTNKIKQSIPGEALIFGNCVPMPLHLKIYEASPKPNSENCNIPKEWFKESH